MSRYVPRHRRPSTSQAPPTGLPRRTLFSAGLVGASAFALAPTARADVPSRSSSIHGQDVSAHQEKIDWASQKSAGSRFAYVKATEGETWVSPAFSEQYTGAGEVGLARGGYHFARPDTGDPATQCDAFLNRGGGWTDDGRTLPGLLDLEATDGVPKDYGLSQQQLREWISGFLTHYRDAVGRRPMVYTNYHWWHEQVGDWTPTNTPLHIANYNGEDPSDLLPGAWWAWEMWQYSSSEPFAGDSNVWHGTEEEFERFLTVTDYDANGI